MIERKFVSTPGKFIPVNFAEKIHYWALDSIGEIAYSSSFGMLENDEDTYGILEANDKTTPMVKLLSNHLWIWRLLRTWPFLYLLPNDGDESGLGAVMGYVCPPSPPLPCSCSVKLTHEPNPATSDSSSQPASSRPPSPSRTCSNPSSPTASKAETSAKKSASNCAFPFLSIPPYRKLVGT